MIAGEMTGYAVRWRVGLDEGPVLYSWVPGQIRSILLNFSQFCIFMTF